MESNVVNGHFCGRTPARRCSCCGSSVRCKGSSVLCKPLVVVRQLCGVCCVCWWQSVALCQFVVQFVVE